MAMFIKIIPILLSAILMMVILFILILCIAIKRYTNINILKLIYNTLTSKLRSRNVKATPQRPLYSFDIYKIHENCDINNISFITQQLNNKLSHIRGNGEHIISSITNNAKNIIMLIGINGSGKTTCCFKIQKLFHTLQTVVCTSDIYKNSIETFQYMAKLNNVSIYNNTQNIKHMSQLVKFYVRKFQTDDKHLMILDTSGRNFDNKNLHIELVTIIQNIRKIENINLTVIYNINCLAVHSHVVPQHDGVILSNINETTVTSNIFNILNSFNKKLSLLHSDVNSPIQIYDNNIVKTYIMTKIKHIQQNNNNV